MFTEYMKGSKKMMNQEKKTNYINIRIDDTLKNLLEEKAAAENRSLSNYIYLLLNREMMNQGETVRAVFGQ